MAVCAFCVVAAASAFAEETLTYSTAHWLENGAQISTSKAVDTEGALLFHNLENGAEFLCEGIFNGTVGANGTDEVTELLQITGSHAVVPVLDEAGATGGIVCTPIAICSEVEIWANNLPFHTELMLDNQNGLFYDLGLANVNGLRPAYWVLCKVGALDVFELCVALGDLTQEKSNNTTANDVEELGAILPDADCGNPEPNHIEVGGIENNGSNIALILLTNGLPLAVSE